MIKLSKLKFNSMFKKKEEPMKTYDWKFGSRSLNKLNGVHPDLVKVANLALTYSPVDFGITYGLRTVEEQKKLLAAGKSKTMRSRHLTGHAIDVVAYNEGKITWTLEYYVLIAEAFHKAAKELDIEIGWGAAWLMSLNYYGSAQEAMDAYVAKRRSQGQEPFIDSPHYQLSWNKYPE